MFKSFKVKRLKSELEQAAQKWEHDHAAVIDATVTVQQVIEGHRFTFDGAALVETRSQGGAVFASTPIKIGGVKFRVGGAAPVKRDVMTVIDTGTFSVDEERASFVGGKQQRTWEFKKIIGYSTEAGNEVLIAVSNRQRMSGVRYGATFDFVIDAALNAAVERYRGNEDAVRAWANDTLEELRGRLAAGEQRFESFGGEKASELAALIGKDEALAFTRSLPGVASVGAQALPPPPGTSAS